MSTPSGAGRRTLTKGVDAGIFGVLLQRLWVCQVAIYAGAGVKDELDAKRIQAIIGAMRPLLRAGRYDEAVEGAAADIGIALAGGPAERGSVWGFVASVIFFSLFFCVLVTSCLCAPACTNSDLTANCT